jgi:hypothetical protein
MDHNFAGAVRRRRRLTHRNSSKIYFDRFLARSRHCKTRHVPVLNWIRVVYRIYASFFSLISCAVTQEQQHPVPNPFQNCNWTRQRLLLLRSLKRHKNAHRKLWASVAVLFVAPQEHSWKRPLTDCRPAYAASYFRCPEPWFVRCVFF